MTPPFSGPASIAVLTDRLVSIRDIEVAEGGTEVEVPVDAAWGPGAYVAVTAFRPGEARQGHPGRALGLAWLQLDPPHGGSRWRSRPRPHHPAAALAVPLRLTGADGTATLTLAAVDEGILRLTRFASPDPLAHVMGKRRLGVDIRDDYGRLVPPPEGELAMLRQGGDEFSLGAIDIPQRTVALFTGAMPVAADGTATVTLDIPDFAGELRLMAVAWAGDKVGSASRPVTIRDPVVAEALLPRFLSPGDEARLPVLLHNLDLPAGEITATLTAEGAITLAGPARLSATLAPNLRALPASALRATGAGQGCCGSPSPGRTGSGRSGRPASPSVPRARSPPRWSRRAFRQGRRRSWTSPRPLAARHHPRLRQLRRGGAL
ncbi:alpha-2-macroglobulin family protein [Siccirubricoccus deserti]